MERFTEDTLTDKIENILRTGDAHSCHNDEGIDARDLAEDIVVFLTRGTGQAHAPAGVKTFRKVVTNNKFGQPGEPPKKAIEAVTVSDLIAQLTEVLNEHGDIPVVQTGRGRWDGDKESYMALRGNRDHQLFEVYDERPQYTHDTAYEAVEGWNYEGPFLNVEVDV